MGFRAKLILSYFFIIMISFGSMTFFLDRNLEENSLKSIKASLTRQARLMETQVPAEKVRAADEAFLWKTVDTLKSRTDCRLTVINNTGRVLAESERSPEEAAQMENHLSRPEVQAALTGNEGSNIRYSPTLKINMLYVAVPLEDQSGTAGVLRVALPLVEIKKTLFGIRKIVLAGLLSALILAILLGSILASRTILPINHMIDISKKFSEGDLTRRVIHSSKDEIGELAGTFNKMAQDIQDKIGEINTQNQTLAAVFDGMIEAVIVVDKDARVVAVNASTERIFGVNKSGCKKKVLIEAIRNKEISDIVEKTLTAGEPVSGEIKMVVPVRGVFSFNAIPMRTGGSVSGCMVVLHDVTGMKKLETMRSDFVANVSHELRTPLTAIKGFVETLLGGAFHDKKNGMDFLKIISDHTDRLTNLVNDLLSLSRIESKESVLEKSPVDLARQAGLVIQALNPGIEKKHISVKNDIAPGFTVTADQKRLEQVLTNLIENAVKFNKDNGSIVISGREEDGFTRIEVEDSGIGIPEKDILRIFERFYRVDKARSRDLGGTGLGLSIVKHIIELHGGTVGVESTEGAGSKFWFTIPR